MLKRVMSRRYAIREDTSEEVIGRMRSDIRASFGQEALDSSERPSSGSSP